MGKCKRIEVNIKGGEMEEVLQELREIKELLRIIASNTEQNKIDLDKLANDIAEVFNVQLQELQQGRSKVSPCQTQA